MDPLLLVKSMPPIARGMLEVSRGSTGLLKSKTFEKYWTELRGVYLVFLEEDAQHWKAGVGEPLMLAISCVLGTELSVDKKELKLKKTHEEKGNNKIVLRFATETERGKWENHLKTIVGARVVGLSDWEIMTPIGKGASGKVFMVRDKKTREYFALKCIEKSKVYESKSEFRHMIDECIAMTEVLGHPFFVQLRFCFQTKKHFYLVLEFCKGGDMFTYLKNHDVISLRAATYVIAELVVALEFFHSRGFIFRDLKPENVLLDENGHIRIADFGLCKKMESAHDGMTSTVCGTFNYAAPEMLQVQNYGKSIDFWALGVFAYHVMYGRTPFESADIEEVIYKMQNQNEALEFPPDEKPETVSFIKGLLDPDPSKRLGCSLGGMKEVKEHPFFREIEWSKVIGKAEHPDTLFPQGRQMDYTENFDLEEWTGMTLDDDVDDAHYGDQTMWPLVYVKKNEMEKELLYGFTLSSPMFS